MRRAGPFSNEQPMLDLSGQTYEEGLAIRGSGVL